MNEKRFLVFNNKHLTLIYMLAKKLTKFRLRLELDKVYTNALRNGNIFFQISQISLLGIAFKD